MNRINLIVVALTMTLSSTAFAANLQDYLQHPEAVFNKAQWIEAGAGANGAALLAVAQDTQAHRYLRMRAASALGFFPEQQAGLAQLAQDDRQDLEVRLQALNAYTLLAKKKSLPLLERLSESTQVQLRAAAGRNLLRVPGPEAVTLTRQLIARESVGGTRRALERGLARRLRR